MNEDLENLFISDFVNGDRWRATHLNYIFGSNINLQVLLSSSIDINSCNQWIWYPASKHHKISTSVYNHLNQSSTHSDNWPCWGLLWKLNTATQVKHFLWILFHGRLSTSNFLFQMRMGPNNPCILCGFSSETIDHLFCHCLKANQVWTYLNLKVNIHIHFPNGFASSSWLTDGNYSTHIASLIATNAWFLWKSRCNVIFRNANVNIPTAVCRALAHVQEHTSCSKGLLGQKLILNNFSGADELFLFSHVNTNQSTKVRSIGFFISNANYVVAITGCFADAMDDSPLDDLFAIGVALQTALDKHLNVKHVFVNTPNSHIVLNNPDPVTT